MPTDKEGTMSTETEQITRVREALFSGDNAVEARITIEAYEGEEVAIHVHTEDDDMAPALSFYLAPVDAAIHAERIVTAARNCTNAKPTNA